MYSNSEGNSIYDSCDSQVPSSSQSRVKVEDALSYLDQVKTQFASEPAIYTQFLDIMKDFKSQAIDTPGVITRVSQLFHGRPQLILGFNTFLPTGFEVKVEGEFITIREPSGFVKVIGHGEHPLPLPETPEMFMEDAEALPINQEEEMTAVLPEEQRPIHGDDEEYEDEEEHGVDQLDHVGDPGTLAYTDTFGYEHELMANLEGFTVNTALEFINKVRSRFFEEPDVYRKILDLLYEYQRSIVNETLTPVLEEALCGSLTTLLGMEPDILQEFRTFLPQLHGFCRRPGFVNFFRQIEDFEEEEYEDECEEEEEDEEEEEEEEDTGNMPEPEMSYYHSQMFPLPSPNINVYEVVARTSIEDLAFFDKVRKSLKSYEFDTFLRFINLYSNNILSPGELLDSFQQSFAAYPFLMNKMKQMFFPSEEETEVDSNESAEVLEEELQYQIDYASCKQLGVSYRSRPINYQHPSCTGRTPLCEEVLNDIWVSFPSSSSEDSTSVASKKTAYEDFIYRTEDERFELDIIIEVNKYAIEALESVQRKLNKMGSFDQERFRLDEKLGGSSASLMQRAVKRIYGEHASTIIEGLKVTPYISVPKILASMKKKEREWLEAQREMNKIWREQNEKYKVRALDHQTNSLKTSDTKWIKAKQMVTHIEQLFDERQQKADDGLCEDSGPHVLLTYPTDRSILGDASNLVIHYVKRQSNIQKTDKTRIKKLLRRYVNEWFFMDFEEMSDNEDDSDSLYAISPNKQEFKTTVPGISKTRLIYGGNALYVFLRFHQILCDRLGKLKSKYEEMVTEFYFEQDLTRRQVEIYEKHGKDIPSHELNCSDINNGLYLIRGVRKSPVTYFDDTIRDIKAFMDGQLEVNTFEDNVRVKFPQDGYLVFTIDKLVAGCARQLLQLVSDIDESMAITLYHKYRLSKPYSSYDESDFRLGYEGEYSTEAEENMTCSNCFKIFLVSDHNPMISVELIDTEKGLYGSDSDLDGEGDDEDDDEEDEDDEDDDENENVNINTESRRRVSSPSPSGDDDSDEDNKHLSTNDDDHMDYHVFETRRSLKDKTMDNQMENNVSTSNAKASADSAEDEDDEDDDEDDDDNVEGEDDDEEDEDEDEDEDDDEEEEEANEDNDVDESDESDEVKNQSDNQEDEDENQEDHEDNKANTENGREMDNVNMDSDSTTDPAIGSDTSSGSDSDCEADKESKSDPQTKKYYEGIIFSRARKVPYNPFR